MSGERLDEGKLMRVAEAAVAAARAYFQTSPEVELHLQVADVKEGDGPLGSANAQVEICYGYHSAVIKFNIDSLDSYEEVWRAAGHEVAHLVTQELAATISARQAADTLSNLQVMALEAATVRLERMFVRDRPFLDPDGPGEQHG